MTHYKAHFVHALEDGFIIRPSSTDIHLSYVLWYDRAPADLFTLVRDRGMSYARTPLEESICQLCHHRVEHEEQYVCYYTVFL